MSFKTEQEEFWAGEFGAEYIRRNRSEQLLASNLNLFARALRAARGINTTIEFGANVGMNLRALQYLYPGIDLHAIEINREAACELCEFISGPNVHQKSILDFTPARQWDLVLIKGVLIHISPNHLESVYEKLVASCGRYLLLAEYYSPTPVAVPYRGHTDRLFKRDFAGEILERHQEMRLLDYGFVYRRDPSFPQDDINWFLLERK